jgi:hypothetical protein
MITKALAIAQQLQTCYDSRIERLNTLPSRSDINQTSPIHPLSSGSGYEQRGVGFSGQDIQRIQRHVTPVYRDLKYWFYLYLWYFREFGFNPSYYRLKWKVW